MAQLKKKIINPLITQKKSVIALLFILKEHNFLRISRYYSMISTLTRQLIFSIGDFDFYIFFYSFKKSRKTLRYNINNYIFYAFQGMTYFTHSGRNSRFYKLIGVWLKEENDKRITFKIMQL
ncbi:hypothetical protein BpHYR1_000007 [Brachionus plicatilis]|uniref:Uncharacterized protein n=1 Tax=Brachionus plicatilis TaxID=10195 RepID=A0A3M7R035_BRAPC|nr:hypothetical protein BpHYR1_000007 [Brachionus plicatilis]